MVQWLRLSAFTAVGLGSTPGWGTKIPQAAWHGQKKKNKQKNKFNDFLILKRNTRWEFSGGLVVRIPGFHCRGTEVLQATWHSQKKTHVHIRRLRKYRYGEK